MPAIKRSLDPIRNPQSGARFFYSAVVDSGEAKVPARLEYNSREALRARSGLPRGFPNVSVMLEKLPFGAA